MSFFFFNDTATTEIYTLSLHDALPISGERGSGAPHLQPPPGSGALGRGPGARPRASLLRPVRLRGGRRYHRSEEHTSELQSRQYLVCRLLLEKKHYYFTPITSNLIPPL